MTVQQPPRRTPLDRSLIQNIAVFAGLGETALDAILAAAKTRRVRKGEALFSQGESAQAVFVILDGRLKVVQLTPEGQQVVVRFVGPGELAGILAFFPGKIYPATALAVVDTLTLAWEGQAIAVLLEQNPRLAVNILGVAGDRVQEAHAQLREVATERVERRIAHAVLRLARQAGRRVEHGIQIEFPISRQDIAEMTGATLHTVSRVLSAWEQSGLVEGGRQRIVIRDPHALVRIADDL